MGGGCELLLEDPALKVHVVDGPHGPQFLDSPPHIGKVGNLSNFQASVQVGTERARCILAVIGTVR